MNVVVLCSAALVLLFVVLSFNTSRVRRRARADPRWSDVELPKAIRAQGNAAEYIPLFVALLLYLNGVPSIARSYLLGVALLVVASRVAHAIGMLRAASVTTQHPLRFCGAVGTYVGLLALGGALLVSAF